MSISSREEGLVSVPFTPGKDDAFLKNLFDSFSYDKCYQSGLIAVIDAIDKPITGLRWTTIVNTLATGDKSVGPVIKFLSENRPVRGITYTAVTTGAVINLASEVCNLLDDVQKKNKRRDTTTHILAGILPSNHSASNNDKKRMAYVLSFDEKKNAAVSDKKNADEAAEILKKYLNNLIKTQIEDNEDYKKIFEYINLSVEAENQLRLNVKFNKKYYDKIQIKETRRENKLRRILGGMKKYLWDKSLRRLWDYVGEPIWSTGMFAAFIYWAIFGMAFITTGNAMLEVPAGIAGIPEWLMFGLPFAAAAPIVGLRAANKYKQNRRFDILKSLIDRDLEGLEESKSEYSKKQLEATAMDFAAIVLQNAAYEMEAELERLVRLGQLVEAEKRCAELRKKSQPESKTNNSSLRPFSYGVSLANAPLQAANTLFTSGMANIGQAQYPAWIADDLAVLRGGKRLSGHLQSFLSTTLNVVCTIPLLDTVIGGVLLGVGIIFGIADMATRYANAKKAEKYAQKLMLDIQVNDQGTLHIVGKSTGQVNHLNNTTPISWNILEKQYSNERAELKRLKETLSTRITEEQKKGKLQGFETPERLVIKPPQPTTWKKNPFMDFWRKARKSVYIEAIDWGMIGVFFGRLLYPGGAAIFFPFLLLAAGPWTIPVMFGLGALIIGLKYWEKVQTKKEERLQVLPQKILDTQILIELARLKLEEVNLRTEHRIEPKDAPEPSISHEREFKERIKHIRTLFVSHEPDSEEPLIRGNPGPSYPTQCHNYAT